MDCKQPKPDSKKYWNLIDDIKKGLIRIPKFQREFVWSMDKTAKLLDSILKGYPIGTFILWQTDERINDVKNIGNLAIEDTPEGYPVQYVLDGQQRITSLYAAHRGAQIQKTGKKKTDDYKSIVVNLDKNVSENDDQVITPEPTGEKSISLFDVLNFNVARSKELSSKFTDAELDVINGYSTAFKTYDFSTVVLNKKDIDSAIEVFTRINTGGQTLTLFEIMSAKTYDEEQKFDMQEKWKSFSEELAEIKYEGVSSIVILHLLALVLSRTKECKRKTTLALDKQKIIDTWDDAISALKESIDYFRTIYRIPVSKILPYDSLLVPFSYFFYQRKEKPNTDQRKYLEEFFWRMSLSNRYSGSTESSLAQDIKRIDHILENQRPDYSGINVRLDSPEALVETNFSPANSYCKAVLCLLAYQEPKSYQDNGKITLENSWLKQANSKNYHYFFPKKYLENKSIANRNNSLMNITLVSDRLRKRAIRARAPSDYINDFKDENSDIDKSLKSHFIGLHGFGIESDDYDVFLQARSRLIYDELKARIDLQREPVYEEIQELIASGESDVVECKSTLRYDLRTKLINKILEYAVARTIAAFLNSNGGDLFIGIDDDQNALGLADDIATLRSKKNTDGFRLHLVEVIKKHIGAEHFTHIKTTFPVYDDVEICRVRVEKSGKPVFIKHDGQKVFFIRADCSSQPLDSEEAVAYIEKHW